MTAPKTPGGKRPVAVAATVAAAVPEAVIVAVPVVVPVAVAVETAGQSGTRNCTWLMNKTPGIYFGLVGTW